MVMPCITDDEYPLAAGAEAEEGRRPTLVSAPAAASPELSVRPVRRKFSAKDKLRILGEVDRDGCFTLRTSIIGREIGTRHGLVEWFLLNRGKTVKAYTKAVFSGFPTVIIADIMADIIEKRGNLSGVWHVSAKPIAKADLLTMLKKRMKLDIGLEPCEDVKVDRSLDSSRFRKETGFKPLSWAVMVDMMLEDAAKCGTLYEMQ